MALANAAGLTDWPLRFCSMFLCAQSTGPGARVQTSTGTVLRCCSWTGPLRGVPGARRHVAARHNGDDLARKARTHRLLRCLVEDAVLYLDDLTEQDHAYFVGTAGAWSKQLGLLLVAALCERGRGDGATSSEGELAGKGRDLVTRHAVHWPWEPQDGQARARAARQALGVLTDLRLAAVGEHRGPASGPPRIATRPSRGHPLSWSAQAEDSLSRWTSKCSGEAWRWVPCILGLVRDAAMHAGEHLPADGRRARSLRGRCS